jgi:TonB family protein
MLGPGIPVRERFAIYRRRFQTCMLISLAVTLATGLLLRVERESGFPHAGYFGPPVPRARLDVQKDAIAEEVFESGGRPLDGALAVIEFELDYDSPDFPDQRPQVIAIDAVPSETHGHDPIAGDQRHPSRESSPLSITSDKIVILRFVKPIYPLDAKLLDVEGRVTMRFVVGTDGRVTGMRVVSEDVIPSCVEAVRVALAEWLFAPIIEDGRAVEVPVETTFRFQLLTVTTES